MRTSRTNSRVSNPRIRLVTAGLAAAIAGADAPFVLVVDDVHLLTDRRCFALLRTLAGEVAPGCLVVFISRSDTPSR